MKSTRRQTLVGAAWSAPIVLASATVPAYAASNEGPYGFNFDGGGGTNGLLNSVYLNFGTTNGSTQTLAKPVVVTVNVVGLNVNRSAERSFSAGSSDGTIGTRSYNSTTRITTFTWTIPAGKVIPPLTPLSNALPDILFSFGDGLSNGQYITNKIMVMSVTGVNRLSQPLPIDSSVVKDYDKNAVSPDGIY